MCTSFPLSDFVGRPYSQVTGGGADRYITCCRMILEYQPGFDIECGFSILNQTSQAIGDYPTQFSMLAVIEDGRVYFTLKRQFHRRFVFSFGDQTIRPATGFEHAEMRLPGVKGVLLSELEQW